MSDKRAERGYAALTRLGLGRMVYRESRKTSVLMLIASVLAILPIRSGAAVFPVTSTADSGAGSFWQAILDANASPGADEIHFNISGAGPHVIQPQTELSAVTEALTIDGYTQPGAAMNTAADVFDGSLQIVLNGFDLGTGGVGLRAGSGHATYTIDIYAHTACDVSGHGEGRQWIGSGSISTDANGDGSTTVAVLPAGSLVGPVLTATATDSLGNTSEFSPCHSAVLAPSLVIQPGPGNTLQLAWPAGGQIQQLQETATLNPPDWQNSSLTPVEQGDMWRVEITPGPGDFFFRLID
jgi:hypothetical protein